MLSPRAIDRTALWSVVTTMATQQWMVLGLFLVCACGGAGTEAAQVEAPQDVDDGVVAEEDASGAGAGEDTPTLDSAAVSAEIRQEGEAACSQACSYIADCQTGGLRDCERDCQQELAASSGVPALRYAACVQSISCPDVKRSMTMSLGPLGQCFMNAVRASR